MKRSRARWLGAALAAGAIAGGAVAAQAGAAPVVDPGTGMPPVVASMTQITPPTPDVGDPAAVHAGNDHVAVGALHREHPEHGRNRLHRERVLDDGAWAALGGPDAGAASRVLAGRQHAEAVRRDDQRAG